MGVAWDGLYFRGRENDLRLPFETQILGVADKLGSLETGKAATLIVTNGDPLDFPTQVETAFIDGRKIDLSNRQTRLRDKYREKYRRK